MSFGVLEGLDCRLLAGPFGARPLIDGGLRAPNKRVLSRHPSIGLNSWHAKSLAQIETNIVVLCSNEASFRVQQSTK